MIRVTKKELDEKIAAVNRLAETNYFLEKGRGGYEMYKRTPSGGFTRGRLGFDIRRSAYETWCYLDGIYNVLLAHKYNESL